MTFDHDIVSRNRNAVGRVALAAAAVVIALTAAAYFTIIVPAQRRSLLEQLESDLTNQAELRLRSVRGWLDAGEADVRGVALYPTTARALTSAAAGNPSAALAHHLGGILASDARTHGFHSLFLVDGRGRIVAQSHPGAALPAQALALANGTAGGDSVDFVRDAAGRPMVAFASHVRAASGGAVVGLQDPHDWLYPLLAPPPIGLRSSEAMLVREEGDSVLVLSPLRSVRDAAMRWREAVHPPTSPLRPDGPAMFGRYVSNAGQPAFVVHRLVENTSWVLVLAASEADVFAPFDRRMRATAATGLLVFGLLIALGVALWWGASRSQLAALAFSRARLASLLESANDPIVFVSPDGRVRECNRRAEEFYGYPRGGLLGRHAIEDLESPPMRAASQANLDRVFAGERVQFDSVHQSADGARLDVEVSCSLAVGEEGPLAVTVVHDTRERRRAEQQLRKLSRAVASSPAAIVITDLHGTIEYVNPRFVEISGYTSEEVIGRNPRILKSNEVGAAAYDQMWNDITSGREWHGELRNRRKGGETYWASLDIWPLRDEAGMITHFVGIQEDVSERRREHEELRLAQLQLVQSQKLELVGRLAGGVAHDFNNLLTIIHGYGEILARAPERAGADPVPVEQILKAADRAAQLTRQLLAFSRRQVLEPKVLDLGALVADAERMLTRVIGENVALNVHRAAGLGRVKADPGQLEQVIMNLVVNARDAMPQGGRITLALSDVTLSGAVAGVSEAVVPGRYVALSVADTGHGMSAEVRAQVFEPFFTTKEAGRGTGLGLATVHGIVTQSGGHVGVTSEPGRGTTFVVYLPRVEAALTESAPAPAAEGALGRGECILLVEDDDGVRSLAATLLQRHGFRVLAAPDGERALELAAGSRAPVDLLLTDVVMPGMSGFDLARRMRARQPSLPVLLVSGYSADSSEQIEDLGPRVSLLQKPYSTLTLARAVRDALMAR